MDRDIASAPDESLSRLRLRLTAWYVGTLGGILLMLGLGLFFVIRAQIARDLDRSLSDATTELIRAARTREVEMANARGPVMDAVDELHLPGRALFLLDDRARPVKPDTAPVWVVDAATSALRAGHDLRSAEVSEDRTLRSRADRFATPSGATMVAVAVADEVELEVRYARLIGAFSVAAVIALVLVSVGGWLLVRQSTAPVERTMAYMRRFMADAAHELRTPLTVLRSRAEVALQQPRSSEGYVSALRGIESESGRLGRIVEDLLTLARADAGERRAEQVRVFLDDVVLDAATAAQVVAQRKGVTLSIPEFDETPVIGDPMLLRQLVMILLDNAVKFTPTGGQVGVHVRQEEGFATLLVEDTGAGISPSDLPHVFERFYRGDAARGRGERPSGFTEGVGLGLSIARWIADAHGADMTIASDEGKGTRVTVRFPTSAPA